jgi:hypothetical protein
VVADPFHGIAAVVAELGVFDHVFAAPELSHEVAVVVAEPAVFVPAFATSEPSPGAVSVSGPQASADIAVAFVVLVPVSVVVVEVDSSERPRFLSFPNVDHFASPSSSVEVVGEESVHSSIGAHTNYGLCSILSNLDLHQNKNLGHCYNNPSPGHSNVSDTNDRPTHATTTHRRRRCPRLCRERHRHTYQAALSTPVVPQILWAAAEQY